MSPATTETTFANAKIGFAFAQVRLGSAGRMPLPNQSYLAKRERGRPLPTALITSKQTTCECASQWKLVVLVVARLYFTTSNQSVQG